MYLTFVLAVLASFVITFILTPITIRYLRHIRLIVKDQHKLPMTDVVRSGGIPVMFGVLGALMLNIFIHVFYFKDSSELAGLFAAVSMILIIVFIGFFDDLSIRVDSAARKTGLKDCKTANYSSMLRQWQKALLVLPAAIPLMVVKAGTSSMSLPFVGVVDVGLLYPLFFVPLGILGAANMVNLLEGLNGLGSGLGLIYSGMLGLYALVYERPLAALLAFSTFGALLAFYKFHKCPAKIIAGDSLTYLLGAMLASIAILGNMEKAAIIVAVPFFVEVILKLRGKLQKTTIGFADEKGNLHSKYNKVYSLPHFFMRQSKWTEKEIVRFILLIEFICACAIWFV